MKHSKDAIKNLDLLFEFASAGELKDSINFLLLQYLMQKGAGQAGPKNLYENLYFLFEFLNKMDKQAQDSVKINFRYLKK